MFLLLLGMLLVFFWPAIYSWMGPQKQLNTDTAWIQKMNDLELKGADTTGLKIAAENTDRQEVLQYEPSISTGNISLFNFDPNKITLQQWQQLGVPLKTAATIQKYLSKGGSFKKPEDLKKIYGMHLNDYERLLPYIQIEVPEENKPPADSFTYPNKKNTAFEIIDINKADTTDFISLPGIGSKLALRIVNFRDKLGGFYSAEQIREIYGLQDSIFQKIKSHLEVRNTSVKKININTASADALKSHPYIKSNIAMPVIAYRNEHGAFSKTEDLKKVIVVTDEVYKKIAPYITVQ